MKIVCLEGCSGTGKTTQYNSLKDYYQKSPLRHLAVVEKDYEPFRTAVREWHKTKGPTVQFSEDDVRKFAKARANTFEINFSQLNGDLDLLLMDRYFYTSAVYQRSCGLDPRDILQINIDSGSPVPNLTFLLDCDPNICFGRINKRNKITGGKILSSTSPEKIEKMREQYLRLLAGRNEVRIIDANRPIAQITSSLISKINSLFWVFS